MKLAATSPWKGSMKQARKTQSLFWPFSSTVTLVLVEVGLINGIWLSVATGTAAKVLELATAPSKATTLS